MNFRHSMKKADVGEDIGFFCAGCAAVNRVAYMTMPPSQTST